MCVPGCIEHVRERLSRRVFLGGGLALAGATANLAAPPAAAQVRRAVRFSRTVDLTHALTPSFPTFFDRPGISLRKLKEFKADGFNMNEWTLLEHAGTHIDAPIHFSADGAGLADLPLDQLVVPLAVIDIADKAAADPDYQLTPSDVVSWERRHGRLARGACVALHSGWERRLGSPGYAGRDGRGRLHFPGFHPETADMLLRTRHITGLAVDTLSLDHGPSRDFRTHYTWLPAGRWGLENVAGLASLPARGATLIVGAAKVHGATGGPARVIALV